MKIYLNGRAVSRWEINTEEIIRHNGEAALSDACFHHQCGIFGVNGYIGVYEDGNGKGAACMTFGGRDYVGPPELKEKFKECSECVFGKLGTGEFYRAEPKRGKLEPLPY